MNLSPDKATRVGRMVEGMLASENTNAKVLVTVEVKRPDSSVALQETYQLRPWRGRSGDPILFVSLPDTADWAADPVVKPVTPLSVNLTTGRVKEDRNDPRVDALVRYGAHAALRFAFTGTAPTPPNGEVRVVEQSYCGACGLPLSDAESIRRGIGPTCEENRTGVKRQRKTRKMTSRAAKRAGQEELGA